MVLLSLALSSAVCAGSASAALPNPCGLLTNTEVAKLLGSKVTAGKTSGNGLYRMCAWTGSSQGGFSHSKPTLTFELARSTKQQFELDAARTFRREPDARSVNGVGQAAYSVYQAGSWLTVWQNGYTFVVTANLVPNPLAAEKVAAKSAIARL